MDQLLEGYQRFRENYGASHREVFEQLASKGQSPRVLLIACCDSRVPPETIFDSAPGEIFAVRNVAALVPPYAPDSDNHGTSAAIEFAVRYLKVTNIIVMGHSGCGGVKALLAGPAADDSDFIGPWMHIAKEARARALARAEGDPAQAAIFCEHETVGVSLRNLMTFPWVRDAVEAGTLAMYGWYFAVETASLNQLFQPDDFRAGGAQMKTLEA